MSRPPPRDQVDAAMAIAAGAKRPGPTTTLYAEVLALREELGRTENERVKQLRIAQASIDSLEREVRAQRSAYADLEARSIAALEQMTSDAISAVNVAGINADLAEQYAASRGAVERVKTLCADHDAKQWCAPTTDEIRAALRGEP